MLLQRQQLDILRDDKFYLRQMIKEDNQPLKQIINYYKSDNEQLQVQLRYFIKQTRNQLKKMSLSPIKQCPSLINTLNLNLQQTQKPLFQQKDIKNIVNSQLKIYSDLENSKLKNEIPVRIKGLPIIPSISFTLRSDVRQSKIEVNQKNQADDSQFSVNRQKKRKLLISKEYIDQQRFLQKSPINYNYQKHNNTKFAFEPVQSRSSEQQSIFQYQQSNQSTSPQNKTTDISIEKEKSINTKISSFKKSNKIQLDYYLKNEQIKESDLSQSFDNNQKLCIPLQLVSPKFAQDSQKDINKNIELQLSPDYFFNPMTSKLDLNSSKKDFQKDFTYSPSSIKKNIFGHLDNLLKKSPNQDKSYDESIQRKLFIKNAEELDQELSEYSPQPKKLDLNHNLLENIKFDLCKNSFESTQKQQLIIPIIETIKESKLKASNFSQNLFEEDTKKTINEYQKQQLLQFFKENLKLDQIRFRMISYLQSLFNKSSKLTEQEFCQISNVIFLKSYTF